MIYDSIINRLSKTPFLTYPLRVIERRFNIILSHKHYIDDIIQNLDDIEVNSIFQKTKFPVRAAIEINNTCNLNCIMCNTNLSKRPPGNITPAIFEKILQQLRTIGINTVALHTVGEPLIYKNLNNLFQIIKKYDFKVNLSTNGQIPKKLREIVSNNSNLLNYIRFSIDGAEPETYESIRKGGKFSTLIESLEIVHKFNRNKINFKIPIRIDAVLSITNINEIPLFFKVYGKYCWPESINFHLITGLSPDTTNFWKTFPFPNLIKRTIPCPMPFNYIYFTYDGKVTLCCRDYDGELIVGDLRTNSLLDIWNGEESEFIREQHLNPNKLIVYACKKCYEPYTFVSNITNLYIHILYLNYPNLPDKRFGILLLTLLRNMDKALSNKKDKILLKKIIIKHFIKH